MKQFGELKGYQGDIKGKALVDYSKWTFGKKEMMMDISGNFFSHEAGMIRGYLPPIARELMGEAYITFQKFWDSFHSLESELKAALELTDREQMLLEIVYEYKDCNECNDYPWEKYVEEFKRFHPLLNELTDEDNEFIKFWRDGYEEERPEDE